MSATAQGGQGHMVAFEGDDGHGPVVPDGSSRSRWGALAAAVGIQAAIIFALLYGMMPRQISYETPALQVAIVTQENKPPVRPPAPDPVKLQVHAPVLFVPPDVRLPAESPPVISLLPSDASVPRAHPVAPPPPPLEGKEALTFEEQLLAAVQASVDGHYPPAARLMHQQGQANVGFDYLDGRVSHITLVQSSGSEMLDKAALATVRDARYPPPPERLLHQLEHYEVWVKFRLEPGR